LKNQTHTLEYASVLQYCKAVRLPTVAANFVPLAEQTVKEDHSHIRYLEALLAIETEERDRHAIDNRIRDAQLPRLKTLEEFDFAQARPTIASLNSLATVLKAIQPLHDECKLILHDLNESKSDGGAAGTNNASTLADTGISRTVRPRSLYGGRRFLAAIDRAELYRKIWTMPTRGVAVEYRLSYQQLDRICRLLHIPKPPRGFWSKKAFGKPTGPVPPLLPLGAALSAGAAPVGKPTAAVAPPVNEVDSAAEYDGKETTNNPTVLLVPDGLMLRYNREQLYEDVWSFPMSSLANKYEVSDRALAKACRKLHVPVPTMGHWNKIAAHKPGDHKPPLPKVGIAPRTIRRKTRVHSREEAVSIVQQIDGQLLNGTALSAACAAFEINETTYRRWKRVSAVN